VGAVGGWGAPDGWEEPGDGRDGPGRPDEPDGQHGPGARLDAEAGPGWQAPAGPDAEGGPGWQAPAGPDAEGGPGWQAPAGPDAEGGPGWQASAGPDAEGGGPGDGAGPEPGVAPNSQAGFGPWETYETAEGYGRAGGYGVVPERVWAQPYDDPAEPAHDADGARPAGGTQADPGAHAGPGAHPGPGGQAGPGAHPGPGGQAGPGTRAAPGGQAGPGAYAGPGTHAAPVAQAGPGGHVGPGTHAGYGTVAPEPDAPPKHEQPPEYGVAPEYGEAQPERGEPPRWQAESADSLTADLLLPGRHAAPPSGWRRALYQVTGGLVRAPQSAAGRRHKDLVQRARTPVAGGHHRVAVLSLKGGVGKTTTTVGLGSTLASLRGDRVIAVDANPDRGTLSDKLRLETAATVRDLLNEEDQIRRYADVRAYTTQSPSGLEVLASDRDPTVSVAFSDQDYADVARVLEHYYSVSITDCGTGLLHSAMAGVLRLADQIVLVSSPSVDGARSASATLDWLAAHNYGALVRGAVVVLSAIRPRSKSAVDLARLEQHFAARCRAVVRIPYDAHLEEGAEVDLTQLSRATADAYVVLAAEVGDGFSWPRH
jgi:MinD-like ATPase involved in chromosome partitioning or flagellar assembly